MTNHIHMLFSTKDPNRIADVLRELCSGIYDMQLILRRHAKKIKEPCFEGHFEAVEVDEFWSFVNQRKKQKRWCWYAFARKERKILAFHIGKRNHSACKALHRKLKNLSIGRFYTDDYKACSKVLPDEQHTIGKEHTTYIER